MILEKLQKIYLLAILKKKLRIKIILVTVYGITKTELVMYLLNIRTNVEFCIFIFRVAFCFAKNARNA